MRFIRQPNSPRNVLTNQGLLHLGMIPPCLIHLDHPMPCTFEDPHFQPSCTHRVVPHGTVQNTIGPSDEPSRAPTRNPSREYLSYRMTHSAYRLVRHKKCLFPFINRESLRAWLPQLMSYSWTTDKGPHSTRCVWPLQ